MTILLGTAELSSRFFQLFFGGRRRSVPLNSHFLTPFTIYSSIFILENQHFPLFWLPLWSGLSILNKDNPREMNLNDYVVNVNTKTPLERFLICKLYTSYVAKMIHGFLLLRPITGLVKNLSIIEDELLNI